MDVLITQMSSPVTSISSIMVLIESALEEPLETPEPCSLPREEPTRATSHYTNWFTCPPDYHPEGESPILENIL